MKTVGDQCVIFDTKKVFIDLAKGEIVPYSDLLEELLE